MNARDSILHSLRDPANAAPVGLCQWGGSIRSGGSSLAFGTNQALGVSRAKASGQGIPGGESGPKPRPMHPDWATGLLRQCQQHSIAFNFKQWGSWVPTEIAGGAEATNVIEFGTDRPVRMTRLPKTSAGRLLAGTTWDEFPLAAS